MGFLGLGKKKEAMAQPVIPELPDDLKSPSMDLAEPPRPNGAQMMPPEMPKPNNNTDYSEMQVPELPTSTQAVRQEYSEPNAEQETESDDFNLDDFDLESNDFDAQKSGVLPVPEGDINIEDNEDKSVQVEENDFEEVAKQVRAEHSGRTGPFYLRVENFKDIVDKTSAAKDAVDACLENGNDIINTNNSQIKNTTDRLQNTIQQVKKKLYLAGDILFK